MDAHHGFGMVLGKEMGHAPSHIATTRHEPPIAKDIGHQPVPKFSNLSIVQKTFPWQGGESETGERRHNKIEITKHREHFRIAQKTIGPAMGQQQWHGVWPLTLDMEEMNDYVVHLTSELWPLVQLSLFGLPIIVVTPVGDKPLKIADGRSVLPFCFVLHIWEPHHVEAPV